MSIGGILLAAMICVAMIVSHWLGRMTGAYNTSRYFLRVLREINDLLNMREIEMARAVIARVRDKVRGKA